jgi:hypothetical protein
MPQTVMNERRFQFTGDSANEILMDPVFFDDDLISQYKLMPNVVSKKRIGFVENLEKIVRKYSGCGFTPVGNLNVYERTVEVEKMKIDMEMCFDEFQDTVFEETLRRGSRIADLRGTLMYDIWIEKIREALRLDIERIYHFGNASSSDPDYDQMNGWWTVHIPALVAANLIPRKDTGSGSLLTAGNGIAVIRDVVDNAPNELKALPNNMKVINVTGYVYQRYIQDLEDGSNTTYAGDQGFLTLVNGVQVATFRGIPVVPKWRWDTILENDLSVTVPNYVEYTTPMNKIIATDTAQTNLSASELTVWFDEDSETVKTKIRFKLGGTYAHPSLISVGY